MELMLHILKIFRRQLPKRLFKIETIIAFLIACMIIFVVYATTKVIENVIDASAYNSTMGIYLVSLFAVAVLTFRFFFEEDISPGYFSYKKMGLPNKRVAKIFLVTSQLSIYNLYFFFVGITLIWKWKSAWLLLLLFILILCTNTIDKVFKQLSTKYSKIGIPYCILIIGLFSLMFHFNTFNKLASSFSPATMLLCTTVIFLLFNFGCYKIFCSTLNYDFHRIKNRKLFWSSERHITKLTHAWIKADILFLIRVPRMRNLRIGFLFLIITYGIFQFRNNQSDSLLNPLQTFIYMSFLTSYYGQNFLSWDTNYISFILSNSSTSRLYIYVKSKYYTLCIMTTISYLFILLITCLTNITVNTFVSVSTIYIYCLASLPLLFISTGVSNKLKIDLKQKSTMSHWTDGSSIPRFPFLLFYGVSSASFILFHTYDLVNLYYYSLIFISVLLILFHRKILKHASKRIALSKKEIYHRFNY